MELDRDQLRIPAAFRELLGGAINGGLAPYMDDFYRWASSGHSGLFFAVHHPTLLICTDPKLLSALKV